MMANRTVFLVDGFNLYHSTRSVWQDSQVKVKWLDIRSLCASLLHLVSSDAALEGVYYFSAFARHLNDAAAIQRHAAFLQCLQATGVIVEMSRFKSKVIQCPHCHKSIQRYEEKETDVAIAIKLFELVSMNKADTVVLVTGDTDLAPAIRTAKRLFPNKTILCAFPYQRKNKELAQLVHSFKIRKDRYCHCQFSDPVTLPDGTTIPKPVTW